MTAELDELLMELVDECSGPVSKPHGYWASFSTDDLIAYRDENHSGKHRSEVRKDDRKFYRILWERKLLDDILTLPEEEIPEYWDDPQNCVTFANELKEKHGLDVLPSTTDLGKMKLSQFLRAISRHFDSFSAFRVAIGEEMIQQPHGTWQDLDHCIKVANKIIEDEGEFPSTSRLQELGYGGYVEGITKYHGGLRKLKTIMGIDSPTAAPGSRQDLELCLAEARKIKEEHGTLPTSNKLQELGYGGLVLAIYTYHGGFREFRIALGEEVPQKKPSRKDLEFCLTTAREVMDANEGSFPSPKTLKKQGYGWLSRAISRHHGGFRKFRGLLGEEQIREDRSELYDLDTCIAETHRIMEAEGWESLPGTTDLVNSGYNYLTTVIRNKHGGMSKFRESLGQIALKPDLSEYRDENYCKQLATECMQEHGYDRLPSGDKLISLGYKALAHAILNYHGGLNDFRENVLGVKNVLRKGDRKDLMKCFKEIERIIEEQGSDFEVKTTTLRATGHKGLVSAITNYHGGFKVFRPAFAEYQANKNDE